jgi:hypothetical protein
MSVPSSESHYPQDSIITFAIEVVSFTFAPDINGTTGQMVDDIEN